MEIKANVTGYDPALGEFNAEYNGKSIKIDPVTQSALSEEHIVPHKMRGIMTFKGSWIKDEEYFLVNNIMEYDYWGNRIL